MTHVQATAIIALLAINVVVLAIMYYVDKEENK